MPTPPSLTFAASIRALRLRYGLSQRALAEQLGDGFSRASIARWEHVGPPQHGPWLERALRLCEFFEVTFDELIGSPS